jgi:hypothetical protein
MDSIDWELSELVATVAADLARDARLDPQSGDEVCIDGIIRRIVRREDQMVWCSSGNRRYPMLLTRWQNWCRESGAEAQSTPRHIRKPKNQKINDER